LTSKESKTIENAETAKLYFWNKLDWFMSLYLHHLP